MWGRSCMRALRGRSPSRVCSNSRVVGTKSGSAVLRPVRLRSRGESHSRSRNLLSRRSLTSKACSKLFYCDPCLGTLESTVIFDLKFRFNLRFYSYIQFLSSRSLCLGPNIRKIISKQTFFSKPIMGMEHSMSIRSFRGIKLGNIMIA